MLLTIRNLSKHFGGVRAIDNLSLSVDSGMLLGLVGDNGAGKSTLLKCITGALPYDCGEILLNGTPISPGHPVIARAAGIEMIYQNLQLCSLHTVVQNISLGRERRRRFLGLPSPILDQSAMRTIAQEALSKLNSDIDLDATVGCLSGGQQQAVAIARALVSNPKVLIMDEPTAALGEREAASALSLILTRKKKGMAILLVTHRLSELPQVADRIAIMRHGALIDDFLAKGVSAEQLSARISLHR
jgi:simple sugar transport system ATP-binding protein